jgi:hypothetical protein
MMFQRVTKGWAVACFVVLPEYHSLDQSKCAKDGNDNHTDCNGDLATCELIGCFDFVLVHFRVPLVFKVSHSPVFKRWLLYRQEQRNAIPYFHKIA